MVDPCICSCDCLPTITIPCCPSTPGTPGPAGANGGLILYNNFQLSSVQTAGTWQSLNTAKAYNVGVSQIAALGDRLKIEAIGFIRLDGVNTISAGIRIVYDSQVAGSYFFPVKEGYAWVKLSTVLDFKGASGTASNVQAYTIAEYTNSDPSVNPVSTESQMFISNLTVAYAAAPTTIEVEGILTGAVPGVTRYVQCPQMCVEYLKKI